MKFISLVTIATLFVAAFALPSPEGGKSDLEARVENSGTAAAVDLTSLDLEARDNDGAAPELSSLGEGDSELEARQNGGGNSRNCGSRNDARPFFRRYKSSVDDHMYSLNRDEGSASGYNFEGVSSFIFPTRRPGTVPFYRLYNSRNSDHLYTTSASERDSAMRQGYNSQGIAGHIYPGNRCGGIPFYRMHNPRGNHHFYTTSRSEARSAISRGYNNEGIAGYVYGS
ncbi:hypothetical protein H0H87_012789 [Tephrocybe sp. NHM501043]|nr:hypothetical protein H0H87_012789 [Tephrocybe sp. NHM501043]